MFIIFNAALMQTTIADCNKLQWTTLDEAFIYYRTGPSFYLGFSVNRLY